MADVNLREFVTDKLQPLLPPSWRLIPFTRKLDVIVQPVVMLNLQTVTRLQSAPQSHRLVSYTLTIIEPKADPKLSADSLDDELIDLLNAIDELENFSWKTATRVVFGEAPEPVLQAYDIALEVPIQKEA